MEVDSEITKTINNLFRPLQKGERLANRFVIEQLIGRGGYGSVYLATDEQLGIQVALKLLDQHKGVNLRREVLLARKISHPNVVRLHDIFDSDHGQFYTMDYIPGESLATRLDRETRLAPQAVISLAQSLLEALDQAHQNKVVHLDLKPENILLRPDGQAFITDFGVARALGEKPDAPSGTPDYVSPEQIQQKPVDGRSDLYSLGVILYEAATGSLPFEGTDRRARMIARLNIRPRAPHEQCIDVPKHLSQFILQLLHQRPSRRPVSARIALTRMTQPRPLRQWLWAVPAIAFIAALLWTTLEPPAPTETQTLPTLLVLPAEYTPPVPAWLSRTAAEQLHSQLALSPNLRLVEQQPVLNYINQVSWPMPLSTSQQEELLQAFGAMWVVTSEIRPMGDQWSLTVRYGPPGQKTSRSIQRLTEPGHALAALEQAGSALLAQLDQRAPRVIAIPDAFRAEVVQVRRHLDMGEFERAAELSQPLAEVWRSPLSLYLNFRAQEGLGDLSEAKKSINEAASLINNPSSTLALKIQFERQRLAGSSDKALRSLEILKERLPFDSRLAHLHSDLLADHRGLEAGIEYLRSWLESSPTDARGWYLLGRQLIQSGAARKAIEEPLSRALVLSRSQRQLTLEADTLAAIGVAQERLGELNHASQYYREALEKRRSLGDKIGQAGLLANISYLNAVAGAPEEAQQQLDDALSLLTYESAPRLQASIHNDKGVLLEESGNYTAAKQEYMKALTLRRELDDPGLIAESQANIGYIAMLAGDNESARVYFQQSLLEHQNIGDRRGLLYVNQYLASLDTREGNWPQATRAWLRSRQEAEKIGDLQAQLATFIHLAQLSLWRGQPAKTEAELVRAAAIASELQDSRAQQEIALLRAELSLRYGGTPSFDALPEHATPDQVARRQLIKAEWLLENGRAAESEPVIRELLNQPLPAWESSWRQYLVNSLQLERESTNPTNQIWRWAQGLHPDTIPEESWFAIRQRARECKPDTCEKLPEWFLRTIEQDRLKKFLKLPWVPEAWRALDG
ncbi:serine/threonine-protein kinase [Microbulbifer elongatus]|uniref:serine/threonine-protein kinase n=1 Tax=Microbulbifer elongatus TaxID=86173 RepID=UPI001E538E54|nr:serine/threonine-protein kinase [Microbulbifer elongatus]